MSVRFGFALLALAAAHSVGAQVKFNPPNSLLWPHSLALSPDGTQLAFTYRGDVWVAPSGGGRAIPVTNHIEMDDNPVWSPDGKFLAFSSNRTGNYDIFVVSASGGQTQRLTYFSGSDIPRDWTADGWILTNGTREEGYSGLFGIEVNTGKVKRFLLDNFTVSYPSISPSGKELLYQRNGFPNGRGRYQGSAAAQLWKMDLATGARKAVRNNEFQHLWPAYLPGGDVAAITVSEKTPSSSPMGKSIGRVADNPDRTPNVYRISSGGSAKRLTNFVGAAARYLTVARQTGLMAFERDGIVYTMAPNGEAEPIQIVATVDDKLTKEERLELTSGVANASIHPKGEGIVFSVRGELWSVPTKQGKGPNARDAAQLTTWEGMDSDPIFHPNGKQVFFVSDREGPSCLYRMDLDTQKTTRVSQPGISVENVSLTPDKAALSYLIRAGGSPGIYTLALDASEPKLAVAGRNIENFKFSPDMAWVAYEKTLQDVGAIWIHNLASGQAVNVTKRNVRNSNPNWSADGKYLYFRSSRAGDGVYLIPLNPEPGRSVELELKFEKPTAPVKVAIDFTDIHLRIRRLNGQGPDSMIWSDPESGALYYLSGGDLWSCTYDGENLRRHTAGNDIAQFELADDNKQMFLLKGSLLFTYAFRNPQAQPANVGFRADWTRNVDLEHRAALVQFFNIYNARFYDPNFHGRDWAAIKDRYLPLLDGVEHRNEMATLLNFMVGELEASHSEVGPAGGNPGGPASAHPGFTFDYGYAGPGLKVVSVPKRTPGSYEKTKINPGEIILSINGVKVTNNEALYLDVLNKQSGRDLVLVVGKSASSTGADLRTVTYRSMSQGEFSGLLFQNLLEWRRNYVAEKSGGKLAYVHIAGMGGGNFTAFNEEAYDAVQGKQGCIIDVRNNGGGNISDRLIDQIERTPYAWYVPRDGEPESAPSFSWALPTVVMMAESSFSNAEMFPSSMKAKKLAKLVGMPTPGYVIWTWESSVIDGTRIRIPGGGSFRYDGSNLENNGERPDYRVDILPEEFFAGKDPQLDKAIEVALEQLKGRR